MSSQSSHGKCYLGIECGTRGHSQSAQWEVGMHKPSNTDTGRMTEQPANIKTGLYIVLSLI